MIDWTKPVRTKGGAPVEILTTKGRGDYPVFGYIGNNDDFYVWTIEGKLEINRTGVYDLENIPEPEAPIAKKDCEHFWGVLTWCKGESSYEIGKVTEQAGEFYCMKCLKRKTRIEFLAGR